jgi:hypothetical protein
MRLHAERVALDLMARDPHFDWLGWWVEVYDQNGRAVLSKAFTDVRHDRPSARN